MTRRSHDYPRKPNSAEDVVHNLGIALRHRIAYPGCDLSAIEESFNQALDLAGFVPEHRIKLSWTPDNKVLLRFEEEVSLTNSDLLTNSAQ